MDFLGLIQSRKSANVPGHVCIYQRPTAHQPAIDRPQLDAVYNRTSWKQILSTMVIENFQNIQQLSYSHDQLIPVVIEFQNKTDWYTMHINNTAV